VAFDGLTGKKASLAGRQRFQKILHTKDFHHRFPVVHANIDNADGFGVDEV
jgi:hypothetical protein